MNYSMEILILIIFFIILFMIALNLFLVHQRKVEERIVRHFLKQTTQLTQEEIEKLKNKRKNKEACQK